MAAHLHLASSSERDGSGDGRIAHASARIRVLLADDHALMRRSLRLVLEGEENIEVVGEADDFASVERYVDGDRPQVLVLDLTMPDGSGVDAIGRLRERVPDTQIVVLATDDSPAYAHRALGAGALGFIVKERADSELPDAVRAAARGEQYVSARTGVRLSALQRSLTADRLTPREIEVLRLIALGHTSVEIARKLKLSPRTVETHRAHVYRKLGLTTRAELVRYALGHGLMTP